MKKKILLCWGYNRKGWIMPFEALKNDFEFVYLYYRTPEEEEASFTDRKKIYWNNYSSGFEILEDVQPAIVVFMSLTSSFPIALNAACKSRNIQTYVFQHGLFRTYKEYRAIEEANRKVKKNKPRRALQPNSTVILSGKSNLRFLFNSLSGRQTFSLPVLLFYFWLLKKRGQYFASYHLPLGIKKPTGYICYTPRNATIYRELDQAREEQIKYTGIPELDIFFKDSEPVQRGALLFAD